MAKFREEVCLYYIAFGQCQKGRNAGYKGYCQVCDQYCPASRMRGGNETQVELKKQDLKEIS